MSRKKGNRSQRSTYSDYSDYYDEENRRSSQKSTGYQRYDASSYVGYASAGSGSRKSTGKSGSRSGKKRRRSGGRYRLAHPEKLVFAVVIFLVLVLLLVLLIKSLFGSKNSQDEGDSMVQIVQNMSGGGEAGTVRAVYASDLSSLPNQMAAYMAGMVNQNPYNYSKDPNTFKPENTDDAVDPYAFEYYIAIDAGHGGTDTGYEMDGVKEKDVALSVSKKIVEYLNSHAPKYYAFLTRSGDANMGDQRRLDRSMQSFANLIVSIHCNGSEQELGGTTAAYWTGAGDDATRAARSEFLASSLMEAAADGFGMWYRETRLETEAPVLQAQVPAVQLELGYVTYYLDNELMSDEELQNAAAAKIGEVLIAYMDEMSPDFVKQREKDRQDDVQQQLNELAGLSTESSAVDEESGNPEEESNESDDTATEE